jgi:DNA-binding Lrp family transcriptional regulator
MVTHPDFIQIPCQLLIDEALQPSDRVLYGYIYWFEHLKNEKCTASNPTLAELMKVDAGSVQNSLNRLEERGYIERIFKDESKRVRLEIRSLIAFKNVSSKNGTKRKVSSNNDTVSSNNDTHVSSNDDQNKSIVKEEKLIRSTEGGNLEINECISYLKSKNHGMMDGTQAENRRYCWLLLQVFGYGQDKDGAAKIIKALIEAAAADSFHSKNATTFKYLYYNKAKIINSSKVTKQKVITI